MTINLKLPKTLEQELSTEAAQFGVSLSEYILRLLSFRPTTNISPKTGPELVAYWQTTGLVGTRPEISNSQQQARAIRAAAENRFQDNERI